MYKSLFIVILILLSILTPHCYVIKQGYYQLEQVSQSETLSKALANPNIPNNIKVKIVLVADVKRFAVKELGLTDHDNYNHYIPIQGNYVVYNLSASRKDQLKPVIWTFPIVGRVPYLGFFKLQDAKTTQKELQEKGYDTLLRGVSAYSTLGFFKDPLFSTMTRYKEESLINVIIHEMVHGTIFIRNDVKFNEALATFIGNKGTLLFLEKKYGSNKKWIERAKKDDHDDLLFSHFMKEMIKGVNAFYNRPIPQQEKIKKRGAIYKKYQTLFEKTIVPKLKTKKYQHFPKIKLNNALILSFRRYYYDLTLFEKVFHHMDNDIKKTITFFKLIENTKLKPKKAILHWLKAQKK